MIEQLGTKTVWIGANIIGIALFLIYASEFWIEPELAGIPGASMGNAFGWFFIAAPTFALVVVGHVIGGFRALICLWRRRTLQPTLAVLLTLGLWVWAAYFDNLHHGI